MVLELVGDGAVRMLTVGSAMLCYVDTMLACLRAGWLAVAVSVTSFVTLPAAQTLSAEQRAKDEAASDGMQSTEAAVATLGGAEHKCQQGRSSHWCWRR